MKINKYKLRVGSILLSLSIFYSCSGPKRLQKQVNQQYYDAIVVYDSEIQDDKKKISVQVNYVDNSNLPYNNEVELIDKSNLWLLFYYKYNYDMTLIMGNAATNPSAVAKMKEIFNTSFERSGNFHLADTIVGSDLKCEISFQKIEIKTPYNQKGYGFFNVISNSENADGSQSDIHVKVKLKNIADSKILLDSTYTISKNVGFNASTTTPKEVRNFAMNNLLENLTLSTQEIAESITSSINEEIE